MLRLPRSTLHLGPSLVIYECFHVSYFLDMPVQISKHFIYGVYVRPEKFPFLERGQNRNFDYKIVISVKNP